METPDYSRESRAGSRRYDVIETNDMVAIVSRFSMPHETLLRGSVSIIFAAAFVAEYLRLRANGMEYKTAIEKAGSRARKVEFS